MALPQPLIHGDAADFASGDNERLYRLDRKLREELYDVSVAVHLAKEPYDPSYDEEMDRILAKEKTLSEEDQEHIMPFSRRAIARCIEKFKRAPSLSEEPFMRLYEAARSNFWEIIPTLIQNGADVNFLVTTTFTSPRVEENQRWLDSPYRWEAVQSYNHAITHHHLEAIQTLLKTGVVFYRTLMLLFPSQYAVDIGNAEAFELFLDAKIAEIGDALAPELFLDVMQFVNSHFPLAVTRGHLNLVDLLIRRGADVNMRIYLGDTPLHELAKQRSPNPGIIRSLLRNGAKILRNRAGQTPHTLARQNPSFPVHALGGGHGEGCVIS